MTRLRKMMLEELDTRCYIRTVEDFSRRFERPPDGLGPEHINFCLHHGLVQGMFEALNACELIAIETIGRNNTMLNGYRPWRESLLPSTRPSRPTLGTPQQVQYRQPVQFDPT